ncbi:MAG TPA: excalibur calcium-binding domain-containing protein [Candidatus Corynebacterium faecipullorum]|nr:excalibur calcium-binding domain-containing protein [Candidatus Corynebacterium faecipullorum]
MDTGCADVWNALERPIYPSDQGFLSKFDDDGDGVGCEIDPR